jgi:hypothetical protein
MDTMDENNETADIIKSSGGLSRGDILVIPAGTHFDYPIYRGRKSYTFPETVRVRVNNLEYRMFDVGLVDENNNYIGALYIEYGGGEVSNWLPKRDLVIGNDPDYIIPDWSKFKVK